MSKDDGKINISLEKRHRNSPVWAIILIVLGVIFLLNNYGFTYIDIGKLWPLLLIIVGLGIVFNNKKQ